MHTFGETLRKFLRLQNYWNFSVIMETNSTNHNRHILQTDMRHMESLLQYITTVFRDEPDIAILFQGQKIELLQIMRNWFRLLQSSVTEEKDLFDLHRRTISQEIRDWKASFNRVCEDFQNDFLQRIIFVSGNTINNNTVGPVMELLKDVITVRFCRLTWGRWTMATCW